MTDETIELLSCPFCGGEATTHFGDYSSYIGCEECDVWTRAGRHRDEAVAAWNRRTHTDAAPGEADDYPGTPLARLDEAVLGRELIAWAASIVNVTLWNGVRVKRVCGICNETMIGKGYEHPENGCLHLRARALRGDDSLMESER